jgi:hypothetical protein
MPNPRPRISILTSLLLITIAGMAIVIVQLWREVGPLRKEVRMLRDETGRLSIEDESKLHAIAVPSDDDLTWKWRIWIPANRVYVLRSVGGGIPTTGLPRGGGSLRIDQPGEQVIAYRITRDPRNGQWFGSLEAKTGSVGGDNHLWVEWQTRMSTSAGVGTTTQSFEANERVELIRKRISQAADSRKIEDPSAGFMIWLEPAK